MDSAPIDPAMPAKPPGKRPGRRTLLLTLPAAACMAAGAFLLHASFPEWSSLLASSPARFTPEAWRNAHRLRRETMARDLLERYPVIGMEREAVVALLGRAERGNATRIEYTVALTAADYLVLTIEFDGTGQVIRAYVRQT
jgi:hypothetical protein